MSDETKGDEPLRCHYCGAECVLEKGVVDGGVKYFLVCEVDACLASGPPFDSPKAARAAHSRVAPAPAWTKEPVTTPGGYFVIDAPACKPDFERITALDIERGTFVGSWTYGPVSPPPFPAEPAKGGGE